MSDAIVLFKEIDAPARRLGVATLNAPVTLNALSADMVQLLAPRLKAWGMDPSIAGVVLDAAGDKAFCAGGDLRQLYQSIVDHGAARNPYAERFFSEEYALDHLIHTYPKPLLAWCHGVVMGGGVGLMAGASHRVVTECTLLAMPEIGIGLFPDVGGSWFLRRMPGRTGLFLALTAAPLNAADAIHCGMADAFLPHDRKAQVMDAMAATAWTGDASSDRATLTALLAVAGQGATPPDSLVRRHATTIDRLMAGGNLPAIAERLLGLQGHAPWLEAAGAAFSKGSPTSAAVSFALQQRAKGMALAEVFRLEYHASLGCCAHTDFAEGIRALLIDKDRQPRWHPAKLLDAMAPAWVDDHLRPRGELPACLADLA